MRTADYVHPFVIPAVLTRPMEAAITTTRKEQREPDKLVRNVSQQGIARDTRWDNRPKTTEVLQVSRYVNATTAFYRVKAKVK
ncbi:hypothetical protein PHMEG_00036560 [Phytophthora megakarya]|uniref:Uncharacterized protein n=1 Tax=Phytophthora megakarya TaxID=4795 RepID=A0A225UKX0_9STRA|nr:hypothetical protein PHMEG_00036560 [Phytophthora megakarya]